MDGTLKFPKVGGLKKTYSFTENQYFFKQKKGEKYFPTHKKADGMTKFDTFHILAEN